MTENLSPTSINDLLPRMQLIGTVKNIELYGAFIDVGIGQDGLVHISQLKPGRVNNVGDVVEKGEEVTVWVRGVDKGAGRIDLTMVEPPAVDWDELKVGLTIAGKVARIKKFGAFIDIGAERDGLVHVSEMAHDFVKSPTDVVKIGEEVEVKIIGVNRKEGKIDLSFKALMETIVVEEEEDEPEEEKLTALAAAFQKAMGGEDDLAEATESEKGSGSSHERERVEQDELLSRTLEQHKERE